MIASSVIAFIVAISSSIQRAAYFCMQEVIQRRSENCYAKFVIRLSLWEIRGSVEESSCRDYASEIQDVSKTDLRSRKLIYTFIQRTCKVCWIQSWEANFCLAIEKFPSILRNWKLHCSLFTGPYSNQRSAVHKLQSSLFKIVSSSSSHKQVNFAVICLDVFLLKHCTHLPICSLCPNQNLKL
jgi:hypothetical protein